MALARSGRDFRWCIGIRIDLVIGESAFGDLVGGKRWERLLGDHGRFLLPALGGCRSLRFLPLLSNDSFVAAHAKDSQRCPCVSQIFNLAFAVAAAEASGTESLVTSENGQILNLVATGTATVCAVAANERAIAEEEQVCVGVEERVAGVTAETVEMPSVTGCEWG